MKWLLGCLLLFSVLFVPAGAWADPLLESAGLELSLEPMDSETPWEDSENNQNQGFFEDDIVHPLGYFVHGFQKKQLHHFHTSHYSEPFLFKQVRPPRA